MENRILCICVWCLQESDGQGKTVSRATRTRHIARQKETWPNPIDVPVVQPFNLIQNPSSAEATVVLSPSLEDEDEDSVEEEEHLIERVENEDEREDDNDDDQISMFEEGAYDLLILHF